MLNHVPYHRLTLFYYHCLSPVSRLLVTLFLRRLTRLAYTPLFVGSESYARLLYNVTLVRVRVRVMYVT